MNTHSSSHRLLRSLVLILIAFVAIAVPAHAREWRISQFHTTIAVMDDSTMVVTERINLVFIGQFQGIHRTIPVQYPGPRGTNYTLFLDIRNVTDESGRALKYESSIKGSYRDLKIFVPGASDTNKVVQISYLVRNGIRFFDDHDELYWNVTGNDWPVPIDNASAFVTFPSQAAGSLRAQAFTGAYGDTSKDATAQVQGNNVAFETTNPLPMRGGLTIDVYLPKGILPEPSALTRAYWWFRSNPLILLPIFSFIVMFGLWHYKGRDPRSGLSVAPMYEPPKDMTPAELGSLVDDSVDPRDITSTLVDLAVHGYIKIEEQNEKVLFFNNRNYVFHVVPEKRDWSGLATHEREILDNMFAGGATSTTLSSLKNRFYVAIPAIKKGILAALKAKGMYNVDPDSANAYRVLGVLLIAAPFVVAQVTGMASFFLSPSVAVISIVLAIIPVLVFGRLMTAKTLKGVRTVVEIEGFKEFMTRVDADRLKRMPPDTFEKFLPFAMALGVEKHWAQAFEGIIQNPPNWYVGPHPMGVWNPIFFTNSMHSMTNSTYEAFTAAPRSSSSGSGFSGGGGGGFSGGGFGGGGGSAF
jgi:uncharacterized membrane protein